MPRGGCVALVAAVLLMSVASAEQGSERSPDNYLVVIETSLSAPRNRICPVVFNVTRSLGPESSDRLWAMAGADPPLLTEACFFQVSPDDHVVFGVSGKPILNEKWQGLSPVSDTRLVENTLGTVGFLHERPGTVLYVNMQEADNKQLDREGVAPFAEVVYGMETLQLLHVPKIGDMGKDLSLPTRYAQRGNAWLFGQDKDTDYITNISLVVDPTVNPLGSGDCKRAETYGRVLSVDVPVPLPAVNSFVPGGAGGLGGAAIAGIVLLVGGAVLACCRCLLIKRKQRRLKLYSHELSEQGVEIQLDDDIDDET